MNAAVAVLHTEPQPDWDEYTAVCYRCGWESRVYSSKRLADAAAERHECPKEARR